MAKDLLKGVYLFQTMGPEELNQVAKICVETSIGTGQFLFQEGDEAQALYIIKYGSIKLSHSSDSGEVIEVARLASGDHFGEMSLMDGKKRNASAEALEASEILTIEYARLRKLLEAQPLIAARFYRSLSKFLSSRLSATTHNLSFAREKNLRHHSG